jgi:hypothetical protein
MNNETLAQLASTPISNIEDVVLIMHGIDELLPGDDGLKWFNLLYLKVTEAVLAETVGHTFADPQWLTRLDLVFAGLYFEAVRNWVNSPASAPKCWRVLLDARSKPHVQRVQFAICGMNAHINHDLQFAIVQTCAELGVVPQAGSPQHQDYEFVNTILEAVEPGVKEFLATGIIGEIDQHLGDVDDILAIWGIRKAREGAWMDAQIFWPFRNDPFASKLKHTAADGITGALGRALIIPVG